MRIDTRDGRPVCVFLFAHQDDECGVYEQIYLDLSAGHRVVCAYLTSGVGPGGNSRHRDDESLAVLQRLGVDASNVHFAGRLLEIADGGLQGRLTTASAWLADWLPDAAATLRVYVPAWEGGHPDHDVLHAMTVQLCCDAGRRAQVHQYALYNGLHCPKPWFRIFSPIAANGVVRRQKIPWRRRMAYVRLVLGYPSQWKTWVGLWPFFTAHHVFRGWQGLQPVSLERLQERPHKGPLYYEMRQFSTWETVRSRLQEWMMARPSLGQR